MFGTLEATIRAKGGVVVNDVRARDLWLLLSFNSALAKCVLGMIEIVCRVMVASRTRRWDWVSFFFEFFKLQFECVLFH